MRSFLRRIFTLASVAAMVPSVAAAQGAATISGRVASDAGAPLPNASVFLEGMAIGTQTREDGRYTFTVPAARVQGQRATVTARLIGFKAQSVPITLSAGTITQDFVLAVNPLRLGEIVVTGAGTVTTREKLGNVVNSIDSSLIRKANETNIVSALAGKAPNVEVRSSSGEPGASSYIRIRGAKSLRGTGQPLFVVDGTPIDNSTVFTSTAEGGTVAPNRASDINPNDVESVEILKGSAAAAIYGARAAEGVVLITTKSGRSGQTRYSLNSTYSRDEVSQGPGLQTRFGQGTQSVDAKTGELIPGAFTGNVCGGFNCVLSGSSFGPALAPGTATFNHFDELFRTGTTLDNTLTVSGGNDRTTFFLSGGRLDQTGTIVGPNNYYDKTTVRLKGTHRLVDRLQVGGNAAYVDTRGSFVQKGSNTSGLMLGALRSTPAFDNKVYKDPATGLHRSYRFPNPSPTSGSLSRIYDNPFFVVNESPSQSELSRVYGNLNADYEALDWLTFKNTFGADYYTDWRLEALPLSSAGYPTGLVYREDLTNYQIDNNLLAVMSKTFSPSLAGSLTLGQNLNSRRLRDNFVAGYDLIAPTPYNLQNTVQWQPFETKSLVHTESYFAQATMDLFDQLYITAAARNDGFSTFGASARRHWFPKASAAWSFTNFLGNREQTGILSFGKLRAAWGQTGKEPGVYSTITALTAGGAFQYGGWGDYLNATQNSIGGIFTSGSKGNNAIEPEKTTETELGADFGFFDQKLDVGVTYYDSKSTEVILQSPLAPSTGFSDQLLNAAKMSNKGWEVTANVRPFTTPNASWDVGVQWSRNTNRVDDLLGAEFADKSAGTFAGAYGAATRGYALGVIRGEDFIRCGRGLFSDDGVEIDKASTTDGGCLQSNGSLPNGALFIGPDGFPQYDVTDRVIADPTPNWLGSVRSSLTLMKKWQFSGLLDVKKGGQVWNGTRGALVNFGTAKETEIRGATRTFGKDYYTRQYSSVAGPGAGTAVAIDQRWFSGLGSGFNGPSGQFIEDGSYVKLRELSVAYTMDQSFVRNLLGFTSIDLRLAGRNLKTWTKYTGIDPESNLGGAGVYVQGVDYFNNPQTRSVVFSVGLNR